jgi:hypothetical protein
MDRELFPISGNQHRTGHINQIQHKPSARVKTNIKILHTHDFISYLRKVTYKSFYPSFKMYVLPLHISTHKIGHPQLDLIYRISYVVRVTTNFNGSQHLKTTFSWDVARSILSDCHQLFRGTFRLYLQDRNVRFIKLLP